MVNQRAKLLLKVRNYDWPFKSPILLLYNFRHFNAAVDYMRESEREPHFQQSSDYDLLGFQSHQTNCNIITLITKQTTRIIVLHEGAIRGRPDHTHTTLFKLHCRYIVTGICLHIYFILQCVRTYVANEHGQPINQFSSSTQTE